MASKADCIKAAMAAGLGEQNARKVVDGLCADKKTALAEGRGVNTEQSMAEAWTRRMEAEKIALAVEKKHTALNVVRRGALDSFIKRAMETGATAAEAILAKLGGAALSSIADVFIKASAMRVNGLSWGEAVTRSTLQYFEHYKGDKKAMARQLGAFTDNLSGELNLRWDMNENLPGRLSSMQNWFFKWTGLNWITESGKAGYVMWLSDHIGQQADKAFDALPVSHKALLEYHGFDAKRWELLRQMARKGEDGKAYLTPQLADGLADDALRPLLQDELGYLRQNFVKQAQRPITEESAGKNQIPRKLTEKNRIDQARRDLRTDVMSMFSDETGFAILEPDVNTRATMYQDQRPGTILGEALRAMMQFKSFPIAHMQRIIGGRRWVRGELQAGMRRGLNAGSFADALERDIPGAVGFGLSAFAFGYLAMTAKDLSRGKTPRDPAKIETVLAVLAQTGGAGILGDFMFGKVNRFGNSFLETLGGPLTGETGQAAELVTTLMRGEVKDFGEGSLRLMLDNMPFVNLWQTREAMNWLLMYHLREWMSPGTLARTERRMQEDFGQEYLVSPAGHIRRGGFGWK
jgi:hypothetical protein